MLMTNDDSMFWACDVCRVQGTPGKDLALVWRLVDTGAARQCYTIHETCLEDLAKTVLLPDENVVTVLAGGLTMHLIVVPNWNCSIDTEAPARSVSITVLRPNAGP